MGINKNYFKVLVNIVSLSKQTHFEIINKTEPNPVPIVNNVITQSNKPIL